jgi:hypothetical protein
MIIRNKGDNLGRKTDREMIFRNNTRVAYALPHKQTRVPLER